MAIRGRGFEDDKDCVGLPEGVESHTMTAQEWEKSCFHATRYEVVIALVTDWFLQPGCLTDTEDLFEALGRSVGHAPLVTKVNSVGDCSRVDWNRLLDSDPVLSAR